MRALFRLVALVIATVVVFGGCNLMQGGPGTLGHHAKIRILVKKVGNNCTIRTVPRSHAVLRGNVENETELIWDIKVKDNCLGNDELVVEWKDPNKNPSECARVATNTHGNKQRIRCGLKRELADGTYEYKVTIGRVVEDPDVEIITF